MNHTRAPFAWAWLGVEGQKMSKALATQLRRWLHVILLFPCFWATYSLNRSNCFAADIWFWRPRAFQKEAMRQQNHDQFISVQKLLRTTGTKITKVPQAQFGQVLLQKSWVVPTRYKENSCWPLLSMESRPQSTKWWAAWRDCRRKIRRYI